MSDPTGLATVWIDVGDLYRTTPDQVLDLEPLATPSTGPDEEEGVMTYEIRPVDGYWCLLRSFEPVVFLADFARSADQADGTASYPLKSFEHTMQSRTKTSKL